MLAYLKFKFGGEPKNKPTAAQLLAQAKPNVITTTTESESDDYYSSSSAAVSSDSPNSLYKR